VSRSADPDDALLRELDRSLRAAERRARAAHFVDRLGTRVLGGAACAGMWLLEGLALIGSPWTSALAYGGSPAWGAWRCRRAEPDAAGEGR
jgi:hypothetical protein